MSIYIYEAYNKDNKIIQGEYESNSREEIIIYLNKRYLTPISIKLINDKTVKGGLLSIELFSNINSTDIMFLVRNLATTIKAGLSIVESLDILIKDTTNKLMKKILKTAQAQVMGGQPLSVGFLEYRNLFPPIFIGMLKAGEASGKLEKILKELANYLSKEYKIKNKVKAALTYPVILLIASSLVVVLMLMFVLPKLTASFASSGIVLPWITKVFLFISSILTWSLPLDIFVIIGIIFFFSYFRKTKSGRNFFFYILSHTPVAKDLVQKVALVHFTRTLGNLIGSGLSIVESLDISSESINNDTYSIAILKIIEDIKNGISISDSIIKYPDLFPNLLISLISVGERTGSLEEILITSADFYEEEVDNKLKKLTSFLEPILLLIMGLMIGSIAVSIILPIYQLVGNFV